MDDHTSSISSHDIQEPPAAKITDEVTIHQCSFKEHFGPAFSDTESTMPFGHTPRVWRNIVGKRVREARLRFEPRLTQDRLSGKLARKGIQLDRVALAKVETGLRCAFDFEVKALAQVLKVDANWLLGIEGTFGSGGSKKSRRRKGLV